MPIKLTSRLDYIVYLLQDEVFMKAVLKINEENMNDKKHSFKTYDSNAIYKAFFDKRLLRNRGVVNVKVC